MRSFYEKLFALRTQIVDSFRLNFRMVESLLNRRNWMELIYIIFIIQVIFIIKVIKN